MIKHIIIKILDNKITHNGHTQDSKSSPLIIIKHSQPLKLILHIIKASIKCHNGSHYPHLLNKFLFSYLNFLGLTKIMNMLLCDSVIGL